MDIRLSFGCLDLYVMTHILDIILFGLKVYSTKYDIFAKEKYFQVKTQCSPSHNSMYGFSGASDCFFTNEQCFYHQRGRVLSIELK